MTTIRGYGKFFKPMRRYAAFLLILALMGCEATPHFIYNNPSAGYGEKYAEQEKLLLDFVLNGMSNAEGGIHTNFLPQEGPSGELATGHDVLSESQGIMMKYAMLRDDKEGLDKALGFVRRRMTTPKNDISWRVSPSGALYDVNAAVDDLRIMSLIADAYARWGDEYWRTLKGAMDQFADTNIVDGRLMDMYHFSTKTTNNILTLCYIDLMTLRKLGQADKRYTKAYLNALSILENGYIGDHLPFYRLEYNYDTRAYSGEKKVNIIVSLLCAIHLLEDGRLNTSTVEWLKQRVDSGNLFIEYDAVTGKAQSTLQSTAAWGMSAIIFSILNEPEYYEKSIDNMNKYQIIDADSPIYGGFGERDGTDTFSFDNLYALLSYAY